MRRRCATLAPLQRDWREAAPEMYFMTIETLLARPGWISMEHPLTGNIFESYEISPDKTTFTFQMRRGMRWSDGEPLTTEDVAFYHEDILHNELLTPNIGSRYRSGLAPTGDVYQFEVIDDYSWRITFSEATPGFLDEVNKPWLDYTVFIQPKHYLAQFHADYADADELNKKVADADLLSDEWPRLFNLKMLTPWEGKTPDVVDIPVLHPWVVTSSSPTQTIFERNPYYFKVDAAGNQLPYIDGIVSTKVEGSEGANLKIIAGEVDLADELAKISSLPLYRENEGNGYRALGSGVPYNPVVHAFNFAYEDPLWRELAGDLRFRTALNLTWPSTATRSSTRCTTASPRRRCGCPPSSTWRKPTGCSTRWAWTSATTTAGGLAPTAIASRSTWKWRRTCRTRCRPTS